MVQYHRRAEDTMTEQEALELGLRLVETAQVAYLTTINGEGFPETRSMFNLRRKEQFPGIRVFDREPERFTAWFTTNTSSSKVAQIRSNPHACVYYSKPGEWRGLMLAGLIRVIGDADMKRGLWQEGWEMYYPGGPDDPDYSLLRFDPSAFKYYHQLNLVRVNLAGRT
jgi:general stress protein 26